MSDLDILKKLEKRIGNKLALVDYEFINDIDSFLSCSLGNNDEVIGLNIRGGTSRISYKIMPNIGRELRKTLRGNKLVKFPIEITKLKSLKTLSLEGNSLDSIPIDLNQLVWLERLYLGNNQFTEFPNEISQLTKLEELNLYNNRITELPKEIGQLTRLTLLDLSNNQLTELPKEISQLTNLTALFLNNVPIKTPPLEIIEKGIDAIKEYFKSLEGEKRPLNEVKVLLVGDGGAGKTSLVKQLRGEKFDKSELQTHGIKIEPWEFSENGTDIKAHLWDFGGQQIMHATHQFFLSKRSLYVLVLDGRKDEKAEYWLKHIESFGGGSPIMVVINKIDENPGHDVNRIFLQEKYIGIKGFYRVSCEDRRGVDEFSKDLSAELAKVEMLQTTWATSWFNVKNNLENMTEDFISIDKYEKICRDEGITEKPAQDTLVDFLNDLGVILHFKDFELLDTHVLEPRWVTEAVYKIINSEKLAECKGVLKLSYLKDILKKGKGDKYDYPQGKYQFVIDLMKKFELCYTIDPQTVLIPDLLEIQEPKFDFDYDNSLRFIIDYDFFPRSIMPRFIVKMHKDIKNEYRWRTGVVLEDKTFKSTAVIKADDEDEKIYIYVDGEQKRDYFAVILFTLRDINQSFEKLKAAELVPMPDQPDITVSYQHLIRLERKGIVEYLPDGSDKEYNAKELLGSIHQPEKTEDETLQILRKLKDQFDTEETLKEKANSIITLQPNFFGIGVNVNEFIKRLFNRGK
ncbi:MAG: GTP-binding protein [candidate division Zixibacteria bacterium]|nr:GTP-binding protein [candidate division Zixibacteria bacterium]